MRSQRAIEGVLGDLSQNWGWLLAVGIVFVVLGTIGLGITAFLTLVSVLYFGIMLIIGGAVQMIHAFKRRGWSGVLPSAITGFLYLVAGISVMRNPTAASTILTLLLALALIGIGFARIWMAVQHRGTRQWIWPLLGGLATALFGIVILARWPVSGMKVIGFLIAVDLVLNGWSCIAIALGARSAGTDAISGKT